MSPEELELQLLRWGRAYGEERPDEWEEAESLTGDSPTARGLDFAPGSREVAVRRLASFDRGGTGRRALMASGVLAASVDNPRPVLPAWACDPVPARETRNRYAAAPRYDSTFTAETETVQTAWLALRGFNRLQAECLRVQYQIRAMTQREKAELVSHVVVDAVSLKRFKDELRLARTWMHARLSR